MSALFNMPFADNTDYASDGNPVASDGNPTDYKGTFRDTFQRQFNPLLDAQNDEWNAFAPNAKPTMEFFSLPTFDWVRQRYSHNQIINRQFTLPEGKDFGSMVKDASVGIMKIVKAAAPFIAMIPGVGTVVGAGLYAVSSIAIGDRIDNTAISTIETLLPGPAKAQFRQAVDLGYAIGRGQPVDKIALDLARKTAQADGGAEAVAAFDAGMSIGTGKGLQDAGFKVLGAYSKGDNSEQRAAQFAVDIGLAAAQGKPLKDFLTEQVQKEFFKTVPALQQGWAIKKAIDFFLAHPNEILDPEMSDLAERVGVPVEAIRAAIACIKQMADGTLIEDSNQRAKFEIWTKVNTANSKQAQYYKSLASAYASTIKADHVPVISKLDSLASQGELLAMANPDIAVARSKNRNQFWLRGFDIATAVCKGFSAVNNVQEDVRKTLTDTNSQAGFLAGRETQFLITKGPTMSNVRPGPIGRNKNQITAEDVIRNADLARKGAIISAQNPVLTVGRMSVDSGDFRRGFDIGAAIAQGHSSNGAGKDACRVTLGSRPLGEGSPDQQKGFDTALALQFGITKAGASASANPQVAAGQLAIEGIASSGMTPDQKAAAIAAITNGNPGAQAGAAATLPKVEKSFFAKLLDFFGL